MFELGEGLLGSGSGLGLGFGLEGCGVLADSDLAGLGTAYNTQTRIPIFTSTPPDAHGVRVRVLVTIRVSVGSG